MATQAMTPVSTPAIKSAYELTKLSAILPKVSMLEDVWVPLKALHYALGIKTPYPIFLQRDILPKYRKGKELVFCPDPQKPSEKSQYYLRVASAIALAQVTNTEYAADVRRGLHTA